MKKFTYKINVQLNELAERKGPISQDQLDQMLHHFEDSIRGIKVNNCAAFLTVKSITSLNSEEEIEVAGPEQYFREEHFVVGGIRIPKQRPPLPKGEIDYFAEVRRRIEKTLAEEK